jgi:hypothetical protein
VSCAVDAAAAGVAARQGKGAGSGFQGSGVRDFGDPRRLVKSSSISTSQQYTMAQNFHGRRNAGTKADRDNGKDEAAARELIALQSKTEAMGIGATRKVAAAHAGGARS